jgi:ABC-2 type transport system ATP-binding protein
MLIESFRILLPRMSLEVKDLSKQYGRQWAVDGVSFRVDRGEVVGFLGPNGAGKSTTMKIATCFLPPTSGTVLVSGMDVRKDSLPIRRSIGYLPEHNPLYAEMYVHEYLRFCGSIFGMKSDSLKSRVGAIIEMCGLTSEQHKKIESLSKGYRQRVGLAQAMLHNPEVLILDEPTSGLDPNQLLEIRKLIKDISRDKTVLFSTHIMQEVQAICDRVVVINKGKIVADDSINHLLQANNNKKSITVEFDRKVETEELLKIKGVSNIYSSGHCTYTIEGEPGVDVRAELFKFATENNLSLIGLKVEEQSLEAVFKQLTLDVNPELN